MPHTVQHRPQLQTKIKATGHPSGSGRSWGYDQHFRAFVMAVRAAGLSENPTFEQLRDEHLYPSLDTEDRWSDLLADFGHYRQCRQQVDQRRTVAS